jgi:hypothetical protein
MTDRAQFEAMLEALINDDQQSAKEIFHNIVVGKSREIYEELLAEDFSQDSGNPYSKQSEGMEEEESMEEDTEEEGMEEEGMEEEGAEEEESAGDDEESDEESDEEESDDSEENPFGDEEGDEAGGSDMEDRVMDLEDALEDLKAEFEQLLAGEEGEEHMGGDDMGMEPDMGGMDDMAGMDEEGMPMMEYVNKVPAPKHGDNGANVKPIVAGKNDMGGTAKNLAQSFSTTTGGTQGGLASPKAGDLTAGLNVHNRPGSDAGKTGFKKQVEGGGIDRQNSFKAKGQMAGGKTGELGGQRGEQNIKSLIVKRVR